MPELRDDQKQALIELGTGVLHLRVVKSWFEVLGWVALTGAFHALHEVSQSPTLLVVKWVCYLFLWWGIVYKLDHAFVWLANRTATKHSPRNATRLVIAVTIAAILAVPIFLLASQLARLLAESVGT